MKWLLMILLAPMIFCSVGATSNPEPYPMDQKTQDIGYALIANLVKIKTEPTLKPTTPASITITTTDSSENFTFNPTTTKQIDIIEKPAVSQLTDKNVEKSLPTREFFVWPDIQLSQNSKFTLTAIGVFCLWTVAFWLIHRGFKKLDNPENSFLGSTPMICGSTEQDSPV